MVSFASLYPPYGLLRISEQLRGGIDGGCALENEQPSPTSPKCPTSPH